MRRVSLKGEPVNSEPTKSEQLILWMRALALRVALLETVLLPHGAMAQSTPQVETRTLAALIPTNPAVTRLPWKNP